jgi:hypothetical protein
MLKICDDFALDFSVVFNAAKSKCLICLPYSAHRSSMCCSSSGPVFYVGGNAIEVVDSWPHLGHIIVNNCDDEMDIASRRFNLIGQMNNIICNFKNVDCITRLKLIKAYCTSLYGCEIWDLSHRCIEDLAAS